MTRKKTLLKKSFDRCFAKSICVFVFSVFSFPAGAVEFNTDVLDAEDKKNIDLARFEHAGYIMPGKYEMTIKVNSQRISSAGFTVLYKENETQAKGDKAYAPFPCLSDKIVSLMAFTPESLSKIAYTDGGECADFSALAGVELKTNQAEGILDISIPVALLEYSDSSWLPPSRWENGIPGLMFDYNLNGNVNRPEQGEESQSLSYYGTTGANLGPWRLRADYQGNINRTDNDEQGTQHDFDWSRIYLFRAIPRLQSRLMLGENYINSDVFESWRYAGVSLESDERMLPPKLRGFAPQVSGIAETNARVVVSQQGRILYDSTVPAGSFTIQDLDSSVQGRLDVEITEQNGKKKTFQVEAGYVPYLTRPGQFRYKLATGRTMQQIGHSTQGPAFVTGEFSWGLNNRWSPYGGTTLAGDYNAASVGIAYDILKYGVLSVDITQSMAKFPSGIIPDTGGDTLKGKSLRMTYYKRFEEIDADITFAAYRFSDENYLTMQQYLDARYEDDYSGREKTQFNISINKRFAESGTTLGLQYNTQTYWDENSTSYYTVSVDRYFDILGFKNVSLGLSASRSEYEEGTDDSVFFRLSVPWGSGTVSYNGSTNNGRVSHTAGYSGLSEDGLDSYSINAGFEHGDERESQKQMSAYYSHRGKRATISANASKVENSYTSYGMTLSGGATVTMEGGALHGGGMQGGTRLLVDTDGIADVPVDGGRTTTNFWGKGIVTDVNSYYRTSTSIDLNKLPEDMEATQSVVESSLTEGAIGYRKFEVLKGLRVFAVLRLADGSYPPFGAVLSNAKGRELGMVSDEGLSWLSGLTAGETLNVKWNGKEQCLTDIPEKLLQDQQLLLLCRKTSEKK